MAIIGLIDVSERALGRGLLAGVRPGKDKKLSKAAGVADELLLEVDGNWNGLGDELDAGGKL